MHPLLIEALLEDIFSDLIKKFPTQEAQLKQAKNDGVLPKYLPWLARMLASGSEEPLEDIIPVIKAFHNKQPALKAKFPDEPSVVDINYYKSVADLSDKLESLVSIKYQSAPSDSDILFQDKKWIVAMPRTTAGSCELGKGTAWCTARTGSQNLFLSYVGRGQSIFLFYVIDKEGNPRSNPDAKLSIGFINGEPVFQGQHGGITVNANNAAVTQNQFQDIVGKDNADKFISLMQAKIKSYDGQHPAQQEMDAIARDAVLLKKKLDGFVNEEERIDFIKLILENKSISPEVLLIIASLDNLDNLIYFKLAENPKTPADALRKLSDSKSDDVKINVALHANTTLDILKKLSDDPNIYIKEAIARNPNTSPDILEKLSGDENDYVNLYVASHANTPPHILEKFSGSKDRHMRYMALKNFNMPVKTLIKFSISKDHFDRIAVAQNLNTPPDTLEAMKNDSEDNVLVRLAGNPSTPERTRYFLAKNQDQVSELYKAAITNPSNTVEFLLGLKFVLPYQYFADLKQELTRFSDVPISEKIIKTSSSSLKNFKKTYDAISSDAGKTILVDGVMRNIATHVLVWDYMLKSFPFFQDNIYFFSSSDDFPAALPALALSKDRGVRLNVAKNQRTSNKTLEFLLGDEDEDVRRWAQKTLKGEDQFRDDEARYYLESRFKAYIYKAFGI